MIAGELDLSVASMAAVAGVVAIHASQYGLVVALLAGTATGLVLGLIQGWAIARLGINSLVFTVGTLILLRGLAYILSDDSPIVMHDFEVSDPFHVRIGVFSLASIIAIVVVVGIGVFLAVTRPGRNIYAIGGARTEAIAAGVPPRRSLVVSFGISGACAALAGTMSCLKGGSAAPEGFPELMLLAVSAALIGGVGLYGGVGNLWHVLIGVGIAGAITVGMSTIAGPSYLRNLVLGSLLIILLLADFVLDRVIARNKLAAMRRAALEGPQQERIPATA
jgi:ribose/xylose/arabinose/galactoside ABC-type transport system permease subunit